MMQLDLVDVFGAAPLRGNSLAVVRGVPPLARALPLPVAARFSTRS